MNFLRTNLDKTLEKLLKNFLSKIKYGSLEVEFPSGEKNFFSGRLFALFKSDLNVNISPKTLAVSANVRGVSASKTPFLLAKNWCTPCPNSWANVITSLIFPWKFNKIFGLQLGTVGWEKAPDVFPFKTRASIQELSKNFTPTYLRLI